MQIKICLVDDNVRFRTHLKELLQSEETFEVVREYNDGKEIVNDIQQLNNELILMDLKMPELDGYDASKFILETKPHVKITILTLYDEERYILALNKIGVKGFLSKTVEPELLINALKLVYNGGFCYTARAGKILQNNVTPVVDESAQISEFERTILKLICEGKSSSEIANVMCRSPRTIEDNRLKLYKKFKVLNKEQLIVKCMTQKLI